MRVSEASHLGHALLAEHGLTDWRFSLDRAQTRCGSCQFDKRWITLSRHFVVLNDRAEVTNVLLHEIAHALAGPGVAHGPRWRKIAIAIGARAEARAPESVAMPGAKWHIVCCKCERVVAARHRRALDLNRVRCRFCGPSDGTLRWIAS